MRIAYVCNRRPDSSNDEEGAIAHALESLGHAVERYEESAAQVHGDLLLMHKWNNFAALSRFKGPKVFWFFDLVTWPDPQLQRRNAARQAWLRNVLPLVDLGFCTDGDAVARDTTGKLVWLPQAADSRVAGLGTPGKWNIPLLFTGISRGAGSQRASFVADMMARYGPAFVQVTNGFHGPRLADLIAGSQIVVAPDSPVTPRYASNRVFLTLGYGGFLLHPRCAFLENFYKNGEEIVFYRDREHLHELIDYYLSLPLVCRRIGGQGLARTLAENTYHHRVGELLRVVKERLL
jgi:hypothetical protein